MHRDGLDLGLMQVAIDVLAVLQFLSLDIQRVEIVPDANYIFVNVVHLNIFKVKFKTAQCLDVRMALKRRPRQGERWIHWLRLDTLVCIANLPARLN